MMRLLSILVCVGILAGMSAPAAARGERPIQAIQRSGAAPAFNGVAGRPATSTPEPGSALVFAAGLLVASQIVRKRRR